jgi:hypothetical protein
MGARMRIRLIPALAILYYVAMAFFVTYPGYVPFDTIRPFVLGMPFSLFWQIVWIVGAIFVLAGVYLWEKSRDQAAKSASTDVPPTARTGDT